MNVEPEHRSMGQYFHEEIEPLISAKEKGASEFFLRFDGTGGNHKDSKRLYVSQQPPAYWIMYHIMLPLFAGWDRPLNGDLFRRQVCPIEFVDEAHCPNPTLAHTKHIIEVRDKLPMGTYKINSKDEERIRIPLFTTHLPLRSWFEEELAMEHMSFAGIGTAHSVAKASSFMLFNGVLADEAVQAMISETVTKIDILLGDAEEFSAGGFAHWNVRNVDWYGWPGWGGSCMLFAPKYKCVGALTVTAANSVHFKMGRVIIVLDLVSRQLLQDAKDQST